MRLLVPFLLLCSPLSLSPVWASCKQTRVQQPPLARNSAPFIVDGDVKVEHKLHRAEGRTGDPNAEAAEKARKGQKSGAAIPSKVRESTHKQQWRTEVGVTQANAWKGSTKQVRIGHPFSVPLARKVQNSTQIRVYRPFALPKGDHYLPLPPRAKVSRPPGYEPQSPGISPAEWRRAKSKLDRLTQRKHLLWSILAGNESTCASECCRKTEDSKAANCSAGPEPPPVSNQTASATAACPVCCDCCCRRECPPCPAEGKRKDRIASQQRFFKQKRLRPVSPLPPSPMPAHKYIVYPPKQRPNPIR